MSGCFKMWKKRYTKALPLASLDRSKGENYVIQNAGFVDTDRQVIASLEGDRLGVALWHNEFHSEKMFKIEPCSDHDEDCVVTAYESKNQWVVKSNGGTGPAILETESYPKDTAERLRPPLKQWRFAFQEVTPGSKKYRIVTRDEELEYAGNNCLKIGDPNEKGDRQLEFARPNDDDQMQIWFLHSR